MLEPLLEAIHRIDRDENLSVSGTLTAARAAQETLSRVIKNLESVQALDLEVGDLVETRKGAGIVKRFEVDGTVVVDFPTEEVQFTSDFFSASSVRKPTPQERLQRRVETVVAASLDNGMIKLEHAREVLAEMAEAYGRKESS